MPSHKRTHETVRKQIPEQTDQESSGSICDAPGVTCGVRKGRSKARGETESRARKSSQEEADDTVTVRTLRINQEIASCVFRLPARVLQTQGWAHCSRRCPRTSSGKYSCGTHEGDQGPRSTLQNFRSCERATV